MSALGLAIHMECVFQKYFARVCDTRQDAAHHLYWSQYCWLEFLLHSGRK